MCHINQSKAPIFRGLAVYGGVSLGSQSENPWPNIVKHDIFLIYEKCFYLLREAMGLWKWRGAMRTADWKNRARARTECRRERRTKCGKNTCKRLLETGFGIFIFKKAKWAESFVSPSWLSTRYRPCKSWATCHRTIISSTDSNANDETHRHKIMRQPTEMLGIPCLPMKKAELPPATVAAPYYGARPYFRAKKSATELFASTDEMCEIDRLLLLKRQQIQCARAHTHTMPTRGTKNARWLYASTDSRSRRSYVPLRSRTRPAEERNRISASIHAAHAATFWSI